MKNELLRHTISTLKYRLDKSLAIYSETFDNFNLGNGSRSPKEITNHMYDVIHWTRVFIEQESQPEEISQKLTFIKTIDKFNSELIQLNKVLAKKQLDLKYSKKLLQGPFSDVLTYMGQIAMLQRINNNPIDKEDFSRAKIDTGLG